MSYSLSVSQNTTYFLSLASHFSMLGSWDTVAEKCSPHGPLLVAAGMTERLRAVTGIPVIVLGRDGIKRAGVKYHSSL